MCRKELSQQKKYNLKKTCMCDLRRLASMRTGIKDLGHCTSLMLTGQASTKRSKVTSECNFASFMGMQRCSELLNITLGVSCCARSLSNSDEWWSL